MRITAIVPARMASTRFPGKPLAKIAGLEMIEHVRRRAQLAESVDEVHVATCDEEIRDTVEAAGGSAIMTADTHERCTERVEEAARQLDADIVALVQGDEPLLLPDDVDRLLAPLRGGEDVQTTNLLSPLDFETDGDDTSIVKAAVDEAGDILYFTRAAIPRFQTDATIEPPVYRQTGLMAFRTEMLHTYVELEPTPLERIESVDMSRLVEHGYPIRGVPVDHGTVGVDYAEQVETVERLLEEDERQRSLDARIRAGGEESSHGEAETEHGIEVR